MQHTPGMVLNNVDEYVLCKRCMAINYYTNPHCIECYSPFVYDNLITHAPDIIHAVDKLISSLLYGGDVSRELALDIECIRCVVRR